MKKFDVLDIKMIIGCKKKLYWSDQHYTLMNCE